jgi:hypothetical protein
VVAGFAASVLLVAAVRQSVLATVGAPALCSDNAATFDLAALACSLSFAKTLSHGIYIY